MKKSILVLMILSVIVQMGCAKADETKMEGNIKDEKFINVAGEDKDIIYRSENISDIIVELFGIDDATAIIFNENAIVGVVLSYDQDISEDMYDTIISLVKEKDSSIEEVYITSNPKLFKQIDNIVIDLLQGKSYDEYVVDINKVMDKIKKEK